MSAKDSHQTYELDKQRTSKHEKNAPSNQNSSINSQPNELVRISKLLSQRGLCSRREADDFIAKGWVYVNEEQITALGTRAHPNDRVTLNKQAKQSQARQLTILLNKPIGYVSAQAEHGYQPAIELITADQHWAEDPQKNFSPGMRKGLAAAGRLDIDSTGLLVLTQEGRIAKQLIGENSEIEKEYLVRVQGQLTPGGLEKLNFGLSLDGKKLKPAKVQWQNEDQLRFILREGKKRQIRRMCELVGLKVIGLKRIRIGQIKLGGLPLGQWRFLSEDERF